MLYKLLLTDGGGIHDVIGTRCDPFTHALMSGGETPVYTCHQNLVKALDQFLDDAKMKELIQKSFISSDLGSVDNTTFLNPLWIPTYPTNCITLFLFS